MVQLKKVMQDEVYETINSYVETSETSVDTYDDMVEVILSMIKDGYCFIMERDILRDAMESLTYMYSPSDDMNKDRLIQQFADEEDEESDEEDNEDLDMLKMMQMMGMAPPQKNNSELQESDSTNDSNPTTDSNEENNSPEEIKTCEVTNNECEEGCDTECKKKCENVD